jgi:hypothetical protein
MIRTGPDDFDGDLDDDLDDVEEQKPSREAGMQAAHDILTEASRFLLARFALDGVVTMCAKENEEGIVSIAVNIGTSLYNPNLLRAIAAELSKSVKQIIKTEGEEP